MQTITINNNTYYLCTDLFENFKDAFANCKGRDVIKKKKLLDTDYIYAYNSKSGWKVSTEDCRQAKVLISTKWKGFRVVKQPTTSTTETIEQTNTSSSSNDTNKSNNGQIDETNVLNNSITIVNEVSYPIAPDILDIEENEKFKDANGQSIEITIRGEREYDKCYFRVKDISKGFEIPRLQKNIIDDRTSYELNKHYKIFVIIYGDNNAIDDNERSLFNLQRNVKSALLF